ncbi:hypothetical protein DPX16_3095 [Anabarilius grahami]|uniref:Uncharacterized protein n=1 Tax=Anabarilius grahami TaxID=495550 RepID=A0A3N0XIX4_ANAGA|nr:hypothetical protein DPX16_3095 [Anabarilius grahami]
MADRLLTRLSLAEEAQIDMLETEELSARWRRLSAHRSPRRPDVQHKALQEHVLAASRKTSVIEYNGEKML